MIGCAIIAAIYIVSFICTYLMWKSIAECTCYKWTVGDRIMGIFLASLSPVATLIIFFPWLASNNRFKNWLNKEVKW